MVKRTAKAWLDDRLKADIAGSIISPGALCGHVLWISGDPKATPFASKEHKETCSSQNRQLWEHEHPLAQMKPKSSLGFYENSHSMSGQDSFYTQENENNELKLEASLSEEEKGNQGRKAEKLSHMQLLGKGLPTSSTGQCDGGASDLTGHGPHLSALPTLTAQLHWVRGTSPRAQTAPRMRFWGSGTNLCHPDTRASQPYLCSWAPGPTSFCNFSLILFFSFTSFIGA